MTASRLFLRVSPLVPVLLAALVCAWVFRNDALFDAALFFHYGDTLLSHNWSHAFHFKEAQVGPIQLAIFGGIWKLSTWLGVNQFTVQSLIFQPFAALAVALAAGYATRGHPRQRLFVLLAGLATIPTAVTIEAFASSHPADPLLPVAWIVAGVAARRGNPYVGGVLIGLGAGVEVWSVLGLPVLLLAPSFWRAFRAGVLAVGIAVALFLPFVLAGDFHMFDYTWRVAPESPLTLVVASGTKFTWALRLLQGSAALAAGLALTRVRRLGDQLPWVTALGIMLARLVLDPYQHLYYYSGVTTCAIIGAATFATSPLAARAWAEHKRQAEPVPPAPL